MFTDFRPLTQVSRNYLFFGGEGVGDTHITGRHIGGGTHITSDMCAGIHISQGYTYHCETAISFLAHSPIFSRGKLRYAKLFSSKVYLQCIFKIPVFWQPGRLYVTYTFVCSTFALVKLPIPVKRWKSVDQLLCINMFII